MAEFTYALTRVCLRSGTLTLPRNMLELFPSEGRFEVLDTKSNEIYELDIEGPRTVAGLGPLFQDHRLDVNDALIIRPLDDGTFAITPVARRRQPDWDRPDVVSRFLDELVAADNPLTEAEIRALHPDIPAEVDLGGLLAAEPRLILTEGRWRPVASQVAGQVAGPGTAAVEGAGERAGDVVPHNSSAVTEVPSAGPYLDDAGLNSEQNPADMRAVTRARKALEHVGFRVEGLGHGQLMAHADLGRRTYRVLVHTLPPGERLDWASLLGRRRDSGARYVAVFGDHRDLIRLHAPAELARATLWSWIGIQRMIDLSRTVLVSPVDLEPYFERSGLFEHGLERFEQGVAKRIEERGAFSAVLSKLASMRAPAIFLLEDLAADMELQREQLLRILERLGEAPFHLVAKIDSGEFCLRYRVSDALGQLSDYALSLRERLPDRRRERIVGLGIEDGEEVAVTRATREFRQTKSAAVPVSVPASTSARAVPLFSPDASDER